MSVTGGETVTWGETVTGHAIGNGREAVAVTAPVIGGHSGAGAATDRPGTVALGVRVRVVSDTVAITMAPQWPAVAAPEEESSR